MEEIKKNNETETSQPTEKIQVDLRVRQILSDFKDKKNKENLNRIVVLRESLAESWLKDIFTFGILFLMFWLNHEYLSGSSAVYWVMGIFVILTLIGYRAKEEKTVDEAIEYLQRMKAKNSA